MAERPAPRTSVVEVQVEGRTHRGTFALSGGVVSVRMSDAEKSAELGGFSAEVLACQLLRELVLERAVGVPE